MTHYKTLGLNNFETNSQEIRKAYLKLSLTHHPDKTGGDDETFKKLGAAYAILSNPEEKAAYDEELRSQTRDEETLRRHSRMATPETPEQRKERERKSKQEREARERAAQQRQEHTTKNISNMIAKVKELFNHDVISSFANRDMMNYTGQYFNRAIPLSQYKQEDTTALIEIIKAFSNAGSSNEREALYTHLLMPLLRKLNQQPGLARINFLNKQDTEGNTALLLLAELDSRLLPQKNVIISELIQLGADSNLQKQPADNQTSKDSITKFTLELAKVDDISVSEALATITEVVEDHIKNHLNSSVEYRPMFAVYDPKTSKAPKDNGKSRTKKDCIYDYLDILRDRVTDKNGQSIQLDDRQKLIELKQRFQEDKPVLESKQHSGIATFFGRVAEAFSNLFKSSEAKKLSTQGLSRCGFFASHGERALTLSSDAINECVRPLSPAQTC